MSNSERTLPDKLVEFLHAISKHGELDRNSITVNDSDPKAIVYEFVIYAPDSPNSMIGIRYQVWNQTRETLPEEWRRWHWQQISVVGRRHRN